MAHAQDPMVALVQENEQMVKEAQKLQEHASPEEFECVAQQTQSMQMLLVLAHQAQERREAFLQAGNLAQADLELRKILVIHSKLEEFHSKAEDCLSLTVVIPLCCVGDEEGTELPEVTEVPGEDRIFYQDFMEEPPCFGVASCY